MRLSPRLLSIVAGTATVASLAPLAGCMESRAAAEPAPVVMAAPPSAPVRGNWGAPISPVAMRPIDFEAPAPAPVPAPAQVPAPGQAHVPTPGQVDVAPTEPVLLSEAPETNEADPADPQDERTARRTRNRQRVSPPPQTLPIAPDWEVAAACGRG
jgi:hypothetical protein